MEKIKSIVLKKKKGAVMENMMVMFINLILVCAFMVIIFGAFSGISARWGMRQAAREHMLLMETQGYLKSSDQASLKSELESCGLKNISFSGTTTSAVAYGERIYLNISGTYDDNILSFAGAISKYTTRESQITIKLQSTAKQ